VPPAPLGGSLVGSALIALIPLLTVFVTLGWLRWKAHWAGLTAVAVAILVAVAVFGMPPVLAVLAATQGAVVRPLPHHVDRLHRDRALPGHGGQRPVRGPARDLPPHLRRPAHPGDHHRLLLRRPPRGPRRLRRPGRDHRRHAHGPGLLSPLRAAAVVLLANTAPVAFGAIGTPIITAGNLTKIPYTEIGAYVGHQTPIIAAFVPLLLVLMADGRRGVRQTWPVAVVVGVAFAVAQWISATWISVELTDIIASLVGLAVAVVFLRFWQPVGKEAAHATLAVERERDLVLAAAGSVATAAGKGGGPSGAKSATAAYAVSAQELETRARGLTKGRIVMALFPYLIVIAVFSIAKLVAPVKAWLASTDLKIPWPGLDGNVLTATGAKNTSTVYTLPWLSGPGTSLLICSLITAVVYGVTMAAWGKELKETAYKMRFAFLTVSSVLALAYVMNLSGQTITVGTWIAGTGAAFAFFSPVLGWIGTAVTGSDTSANALFATLQQTAAKGAGLDPTLLVAANTSGGVVGKMISPQNLTIAATAVGLVGRESDIFRKVILWSVGLIIVMCLLVGLQSTVLAWMLPEFVK
jgi:lactate permease